MITHIRHTGIVVDNLKSALEFYQGLLGFQIVKTMEENGPFIETILGLDGVDLTDLDGYNDLVLRQTIIDANELQPSALSPEQVDDIMAFLKALTDWNSFERGGMIPAEVPSGLPVFD